MKITLTVPDHYGFRDHGIYDFEDALGFFDWELKDTEVVIDFSKCNTANYQAFSLIVLYVWHLKENNCFIKFKFSTHGEGASMMWRQMGAIGWSQVLKKEHQNFIGSKFKPLIALRSQADFSKALAKAEEYSKGFNVEYEKTLRYVLSELLYNTLEHGQRWIDSTNPAFVQRQLRCPVTDN